MPLLTWVIPNSWKRPQAPSQYDASKDNITSFAAALKGLAVNKMPKTSNGFLLAAEKKTPDMADDPRRFRSGSDSIIGHRRDPVVNTLFKMQIRWGDDRQTWVPENSIQKDAKKALFAYWGSVKGGRPGAMADKDLWHPFKILGHKGKTSDDVKFEVVWVGSEDSSWELESMMLDVAPGLVKSYWGSKSAKRPRRSRCRKKGGVQSEHRVRKRRLQNRA
ncbi:hypothetical protein LZ30DRAFT_816445 [Colletotrichum cereale]|nr:hypothetical protein LZ30DRAFT_816445 [Colletotrichum cereale]